MKTLEKQIIEKLSRFNNNNIGHEKDDIPNNFDDFSIEELLYLREHKELLDKFKITKKEETTLKNN